MIIKRVAPMSCAKIAGFLYGALGLIFGALFSLISLVGLVAADRGRGAFPGFAFGIGAVIFMPILYGLLGFVVTFVGAALFNVATGVVGGIQIDVE